MSYKLAIFSCIFSLSNALSGPTIPEVCPTIVSRTRWGGRSPLEIHYALFPVENVIIHHTAGPECSTEEECGVILRGIQDYHMDQLDFDDIGYNFLVGGDGNIYEGAGWHKVGAHTIKYNSKSLGVAFIGNFQNKLPKTKQLKVAKDFIKCAFEIGEISEDYKLYGGKQLSSTLSPGLRLYREIQNWPHFANTPKKSG